MRRLVKKFEKGETITEKDLLGLELPFIGSGGQAQIQLVKISEDESYVIKSYAKVVKDNKRYDETVIVDETNEKTQSYAEYEVRRLKDCAHPNVLKCFGFTQTYNGNWVLLLQHAENGDIQSYYKRLREEHGGELTKKAISISKRLELVFQLCCAMRHMHALGIFHRDLKPLNLMVSKSVNLLLGDFGATKDEKSLQENSEQTGLYSKFFADAAARAGNFTPASDVYAFALCAYFILHGETLFNESNEKAYDLNTEKNKKGSNHELLQKTVNICLADDHDARPDFNDL